MGDNQILVEMFSAIQSALDALLKVKPLSLQNEDGQWVTYPDNDTILDLLEMRSEIMIKLIQLSGKSE